MTERRNDGLQQGPAERICPSLVSIAVVKQSNQNVGDRRILPTTSLSCQAQDPRLPGLKS